MTRARGRQTTYTEKLADEIVEKLGDGQPLAQIVREKGVGLTTVYDWQKAHPEFAERVAHAREAGFEVIAVDALRIADTPVEGVTEEMETNEAGELKVTKRKREDMLGHRKLQIETRLKLLACWDPKRFGNKVDHNHGGKLTLEQLVSGTAES